MCSHIHLIYLLLENTNECQPKVLPGLFKWDIWYSIRVFLIWFTKYTNSNNLDINHIELKILLLAYSVSNYKNKRHCNKKQDIFYNFIVHIANNMPTLYTTNLHW